MRSDKPNVIVDLSFQFSIDIIKFAERLEQQKKFIIANQILRSGTSIGANVRKPKMLKVKQTSSTK